jgi:predicted glycoside hydrolase/deacetylase ChbG (UPF0249 family)
MKLIINADDFGRSPAINSTIRLLHQAGVVTSATLMAGGEAFSDAVLITKDCSELGVGVHLAIDGPFRVGTAPSTLTNPETGLFYTHEQVVQKLKRFAIRPGDVVREFSLQLERILSHGIRITHADVHHHLHIYPAVLYALCNTARKFGIRHIRSQHILIPAKQDLLNRFYRLSHQQILRLFSNPVAGYFDPEIQSQEDHAVALKRLTTLLSLDIRCAEVMLHPTDPGDPETSFFISPEVQSLLKRIKLVNYHSMQGS